MSGGAADALLSHELPASKARFVGERVVRDPEGGCVLDWQVTVALEVAWTGPEHAAADKTLSLMVDMDGGGSQFGVLAAGKLQQRVTTSSGRQRYAFRLSAHAARCSVELVRLNEPQAIQVCCLRHTHAATLHAFSLSPGWAFAEAKPADRRIEVIGDSNPAAFGNEGAATLEANLCAIFGIRITSQNALGSWAYVLAHMLRAEVSLVAWSGVGVHTNAPMCGDTKLEDLFRRAVAARDEPPDWEAWQPDLVAIDVGGNDLYAASSRPSQADFVAAYLSLLQCVRAKRPHAFILCIIPCIGSPGYLKQMKADGGNRLPGYIGAAVEQFVSAGGDARCVVGDIESEAGLIWPEDGGTMEHWNTTGQTKMARAIASQVEALTGWTRADVDAGRSTD